jgi:hypothetical protein
MSAQWPSAESNQQQRPLPPPKPTRGPAAQVGLEDLSARQQATQRAADQVNAAIGETAAALTAVGVDASAAQKWAKLAAAVVGLAASLMIGYFAVGDRSCVCPEPTEQPAPITEPAGGPPPAVIPQSSPTVTPTRPAREPG